MPLNDAHPCELYGVWHRTRPYLISRGFLFALVNKNNEIMKTSYTFALETKTKNYEHKSKTLQSKLHNRNPLFARNFISSY
jgi:hypothetical protein